MQERNSFSLRADPRPFIDELNAGRATPIERRVEVIDRKADVMDARTTLRHEARDRRGGIVRLQELYQRLARVEPHYPGAIGIVEAHLPQTQYIAKEGKTFGDGPYRDPDVGNARAARG